MTKAWKKNLRYHLRTFAPKKKPEVRPNLTDFGVIPPLNDEDSQLEILKQFIKNGVPCRIHTSYYLAIYNQKK